MNLQAKAISEEEAQRLGGVPFSHPCRIGTDRVKDETWIIHKMIADLDRGNIAWLVVKLKHRNSTSVADALELWKLH